MDCAETTVLKQMVLETDTASVPIWKCAMRFGHTLRLFASAIRFDNGRCGGAEIVVERRNASVRRLCSFMPVSMQASRHAR
jgi:hypothetical protein